MYIDTYVYIYIHGKKTPWMTKALSLEVYGRSMNLWLRNLAPPWILGWLKPYQ